MLEFVTNTRQLARKTFLAIAFVAGVSLALAIGSLSARLVEQLERNRHAPRDNVHWSILQIQTELASLRLSLNEALPDNGETIQRFKTRFDIFYSRVNLLENAPIFEKLRQQAFFDEGVSRLRALLEDLTPIVDAGDAAIMDQRGQIARRLAASSQQTRAFILASIAHFSKLSDQERRDLSNLLYSLGGLVVVLLVVLAAAILSLLRHSAKLERRSRELIESESRMAATVGAALDAVIVADVDGTVLEFNEQASECFGYARQDAIGRSLAELIVPEHMRDMHEAGMKRFQETGETKIIGQRIEIDALHAQGHLFPVELAVGAATSAGETIFVAYARDISKRRKDEQDLRVAREEAEAADQAKSRFLAVMSHEMRTPLNGITGVLQLLRDTPLDDQQRTLIDTADRSGEVLLDLINDVLDISKMEAGKLHLNTVDFEPRDLLRRVYDILKADAEARGNAIVVETDNGVPPNLHGDEKRLTQVLLNLTANANKFTSGGSIVIQMRSLETSDGAASIRFSVEDNGIGIPKDKIATLFTEFTSLDNSYNRRQGGTGLGLSICRHLVGLMGGEIKVTSTFGSGSCFWFDITLPVVTREEDDPGPACEAATFTGLSGRLLLAEDNPTNAMVAKTILTSAGFEVAHVADGQQAFTAARSGGFDLILMDISMPELDGMEATRLIRQLPGCLAEVPVVAMTAHALSGDREKFLEAGMDDYVTKPIRKAALIDVVQLNLPTSSSPASTEQRIEGTSDDAAPASAPAFLASEVAQLAEDVGEELIPILMQQFAQDTQLRGETISAAVDRRDLQAIRQAAHALKGSAATIGARTLANSAAHLEQAAEAADWCAVQANLPAFFRNQAAALREAAERGQPKMPEQAMAEA